MATRKAKIINTTVGDSLVNLVSAMGTTRDKASHSTYVAPMLTHVDALNAYRSSWLARKIIDIPPLDATRKWRCWQAESDAIELIEAEEKRLGVRAKVRKAMTMARLFGGAAIFIGTGDTATNKPLRPEIIKQGGIKYLAVLNCRDLSATELEQDVMQPGYGLPKMYRASGSTVDIHPSRLIVFHGAEIPDTMVQSVNGMGWGDSVLAAMLSALHQTDGTMANVASLVFEAKIDVIKMEDFMDNVADKEYRDKLILRGTLASMSKGINGTVILDAKDTYESKSASFGTLPDIMDRYLQAAAGAADIPATRLLGQAPAGLSSTGESDIRNYYDRVQANQSLDIGPAMSVFDECLIRSATGMREPDIHYRWESLWQSTPKEQAEIGKLAAETIKTLNETRLWPTDPLSKAATNMLTELGTMPGLESALDDDAGEIEPEEPPEPIDETGENSND